MTVTRRKLAVAVLAATLAAGGASLAYFTGRGAGGSTAGVATAGDPVSIEAVHAAGDLFPGASAAVELRLSNPNDTTVRVGSLELTGWSVDEGHAGCVDPDLTLSTPETNGGAGWSIPAGGFADVVLADAVAMGSDADDACQGALFTVDVEALG